MEHQYITPLGVSRDAWSQSSTRYHDNSSSSSGIINSSSSKDNMNDEWSHRPRQQHHIYKKNCTDRQRWSTYTADSSSTALESGTEDSLMYARTGSKTSCDESATLIDEDEVQEEENGSITPGPLDLVEDKLNTALASMLSTANDLLLSSMTARTDLARLQIKESALDEQLDRREEAILSEIKNNEKMMKWMEKASEQLDRVLEETSSGSSSSSRSNMQSNGAAAAAAAWSRTGPGEGRPMYWRAPSTTGQVSSLHTASSLGIFDAKDESKSTTSKSAAKRLENVLKRANSSSNHSRGDSAHVQDHPSSILTTKSLEKTDLATRLGMPSSHTLNSAQAPALHLAPSSKASIGPSMAHNASPSLSEVSEFRARTPSISSESGPSSLFSNREDTSTSAIQVLLTPQTPYEELPNLTSLPSPLGLGDAEARLVMSKRSVSSLRSPNPINTSRKMSSGPIASEAALNQSSWQQEDTDTSSLSSNQLLGSRGALESLRKLNGGASFGQTATPPPPSPRWGGAFASWVGISSPNPNQ